MGLEPYVMVRGRHDDGLNADPAVGDAADNRVTPSTGSAREKVNECSAVEHATLRGQDPDFGSHGSRGASSAQ